MPSTIAFVRKKSPRYIPLLTVNDFLSQEGDKLIRLWIHEVYRVFYDRLIAEEDRQTFFQIIKETTSNFFKQTVDKVLLNNYVYTIFLQLPW